MPRKGGGEKEGERKREREGGGGVKERDNCRLTIE